MCSSTNPESGTLRRSDGKSLQVLIAGEQTDNDRITEIADEIFRTFRTGQDGTFFSVSGTGLISGTRRHRICDLHDY